MWDLKPFHKYTLCSKLPMKIIMFFQCGISNPLVYILYVPKKKSYIFSMWDKNSFGLNTLTLRDNIIAFQCVIWNSFIYIYIYIYILCSYKKSYICLMWDLKLISIYTICSQEKNYIFSMWDSKPISIYTLCSQEKVMFFQYGIKKILV